MKKMIIALTLTLMAITSFASEIQKADNDGGN